MGRSKNKKLDEVDILRTENRELKGTIKSLLRQIRKLEKEYKTEFVQEELIEEDLKDKIPKHPKCPKCNRGDIKAIQLGIRTMQTCTYCDHRKVIKNA